MTRDSMSTERKHNLTMTIVGACHLPAEEILFPRSPLVAAPCYICHVGRRPSRRQGASWHPRQDLSADAGVERPVFIQSVQVFVVTVVPWWSQCSFSGCPKHTRSLAANPLKAQHEATVGRAKPFQDTATVHLATRTGGNTLVLTSP